MYVYMYVYIVCVSVCIYVRIYEYMYIFQLCILKMYYVCIYLCLCDLPCVRCISSSDCDSFSMSSMERAVKVSDWSLQAILSNDSMAMLPTIGFIYIHTYIQTCVQRNADR